MFKRLRSAALLLFLATVATETPAAMGPANVLFLMTNLASSSAHQKIRTELKELLRQRREAATKAPKGVKQIRFENRRRVSK